MDKTLPPTITNPSNESGGRMKKALSWRLAESSRGPPALLLDPFAQGGDSCCLKHYWTVKVALLLVALPTLLLTVTEKRAPWSNKVVVAMVYAALVAPAMLVPFFIH